MSNINLSQNNVNLSNSSIEGSILTKPSNKKETKNKRKPSKTSKNLSNQLGFSFDDGDLKTAKEIEANRWLKENKVKLLSRNKKLFEEKLSERFVSKNLINHYDENINSSENEDLGNLMNIDELENFENSESQVVKLMYEELKRLQSLTLEEKIQKTLSVLDEALETFGIDALACCDSGGGKDSATLSHIIRHHWKKDILHIFSNTTCEFPETLQFIQEKAIEDNVDIVMVSPEITFNQVVKKYGFPMISKNISKSIRIHNNTLSSDTKWKIEDYMSRREKKWVGALGCPFSDRCCDKLKKEPMRKFQRAFGIKCAIVGTTAEESRQRTKEWIATGCNSFNGANPKSMPLSIWTEKDIWEYINKYNVKLSKIYSMNYERNGCLYCGFGAHLQKGEKNRIKMLKETHPHAYGVFLRNYAKYFDMMQDLGYSGFEY